MQEASLLLGEDSPRLALLYINRAIEMLPDNAEYLCARAELLYTMGEKNKALSQFARAAEMDPALHRAHYGVGRILAAKGDKSAAEHLDKAIALDGSVPDYHAEKARWLARDPARYEEALHCFDAALTLDNRRWEDVLAQARLMEEHADIPGAVEHYRRALLIHRDCLEANARLGVLLADHNPAAALAYLERALELDPNNYLHRVWRGRILYASGEHGAAESEYLAALELGGETDEVYSTLALVLYEKLPETALKYCRLAVEKKPDSASYRLLCGRIHLLLGEPENAGRAFAEALERDPKCHEALGQIALLQLHRGEEACFETIDAALAIDKQNADYLYHKARMLHELRGEDKESVAAAIGCLRAALQIQPASLAPRELLVELLGKNGKPVKRLFEKRKLERYRQRAAQAEQQLRETHPAPPLEAEKTEA